MAAIGEYSPARRFIKLPAHSLRACLDSLLYVRSCQYNHLLTAASLDRKGDGSHKDGTSLRQRQRSTLIMNLRR